MSQPRRLPHTALWDSFFLQDRGVQQSLEDIGQLSVPEVCSCPEDCICRVPTVTATQELQNDILSSRSELRAGEE